MKTSLPFAIALMLVASSLVAAADGCADKPGCWPEGSAMRTLLLDEEAGGKLRTELQQRHEELVALAGSATTQNRNITLRVESRLLAALKDQQVQWIRYRDAECELQGALTGAGGAWQGTWAGKCANKLTEQRLRQVTAALGCIKAIPANEQLLKQSSCLEQLAVLSRK